MKSIFKLFFGLVLLCIGLGFTSCKDDIELVPITYSVNSGSDNLAVFVYDNEYRDANKCVPNNIRRIQPVNGIYETTVWSMPGSPLGLFVIHTKDAGDIGKVVIKSNQTIVYRSETNKSNSLSFTGTVGYSIKQNKSNSKSICNNPLIEQFSENY